MAPAPTTVQGPGSTPHGRWTPTGARAQGTGRATVAYLLLPLTGLLVLAVTDRQDKYTRFHALQATGLGLATLVLLAVLVLLPTAMGATSDFVPALLQSLLLVGVIAVVVVLMLHAHEGRLTRVPLIGEYARRIA